MILQNPRFSNTSTYFLKSWKNAILEYFFGWQNATKEQIMFKRQIRTSINDGYNNNKNTLLIYGARQIGKTTTIQEFLKKNKK